MSRRSLRVSALVLFTLVLPNAGAAQQIRAFLFDSVQATPVRGGFVALLDRNDSVVARTLNYQDGLVALQVPRAGRYRLRYERGGFQNVESKSFDLSGDGVVDLTFDLSLAPLELGDASERVCGNPARGSPTVATAWGEVQKIMHAVIWLAGRDLLLHRTLSYRGDPGDSLTERSEQSVHRSGIYQPLLSFATRDQLSAGYLRTQDDDLIFFLPDPTVVLDPLFAETHCFQLTQNDERVGLEFSPRERARVTEIEGTFWFDTSALLESITYSYVSANEQMEEGEFGGNLSFTELEHGEWIVESWQVRYPAGVAGLQSSVPVSLAYEGEDVLEIVDTEGVTLHHAADAVLVGSVRDSVSGTPLSNATVLLDGTNARTRTDTEGRFILRGSFAGNYGVTYFHPRLDSLGFKAPMAMVSLRPNRRSEVHFGVPSTDAILSNACTDATSRGMPFITGSVIDERGQPVPDAEVFVSSPSVPPSLQIFEQFDEVQGVVSADERGRYTICGAIPGARISLRAASREKRSDFVALVFVENGVMSAEVFHEMTNRAWRQDLRLLDAERQTAVLEGFVTDSAGAPFHNANVRLTGTEIETTSDSLGHFLLAGLPGGWARIEVRSVGHRAVERDIELRLDGTLRLEAPALTLEPLPVQLADIVVEARAPTERRRGLSDFEERKRQGQGTYLTRDDFMRMGSPVNTSDVLRTVRGLRVYKQGLTTVIETSRGATTFAGPCNPSIYLDNMYLGNTATTDLDTVVNLEHVEAVEAYTGSTVPFRFNRGCGAIVIWTR